GQQGEVPEAERKPRAARLQPFTYPDSLVHRVWKVPGHRQLSHVLGLAESNDRGEFASPGWVLVSLTGRATVRRVPVVFLMVGDHQAPIPPDFETQENGF